MRRALLAIATTAVALASPTAGTAPGPARPTSVDLASRPIPNVPGKRLVSRIIDYPPGADLGSHRHARSAFIYAHVLAGEIRSQVDDAPARVYGPGDIWFEDPGSHHRVSQNASKTRPARLLAVIIVDAEDTQLTIPDPR